MDCCDNEESDKVGPSGNSINRSLAPSNSCSKWVWTQKSYPFAYCLTMAVDPKVILNLYEEMKKFANEFMAFELEFHQERSRSTGSTVENLLVDDRAFRVDYRSK